MVCFSQDLALCDESGSVFSLMPKAKKNNKQKGDEWTDADGRRAVAGMSVYRDGEWSAGDSAFEEWPAKGGGRKHALAPAAGGGVSSAGGGLEEGSAGGSRPGSPALPASAPGTTGEAAPISEARVRALEDAVERSGHFFVGLTEQLKALTTLQAKAFESGKAAGVGEREVGAAARAAEARLAVERARLPDEEDAFELEAKVAEFRGGLARGGTGALGGRQSSSLFGGGGGGDGLATFGGRSSLFGGGGGLTPTLWMGAME